MNKGLPNLSVIDIAEICGVARSTVSYWIAKKSLQAHRSGNKYVVSVEDLVLFLKSEGHEVPQILLEQVGGVYHQPIRPLKQCWNYWENYSHKKRCRHCSVFTYQIDECFTARDTNCGINCHECQYFGEYYGPHLSFIHQIEKPASVYKDLYVWSGNNAWAKLCGFGVGELIGIGIEEFIHPDSLKTVINYNKRRIQGDPTVPDRYRVTFSSKSGGKTETCLAISSLTRPANTLLAVAEEVKLET
jgi:excisionase family DNA binding protein